LTSLGYLRKCSFFVQLRNDLKTNDKISNQKTRSIYVIKPSGKWKNWPLDSANVRFLAICQTFFCTLLLATYPTFGAYYKKKAPRK
jgi:hypothetical protein